MPVILPEEMDYSNDNIVLILTGMPGTGKTFVTCSAPDVVVVDLDNGMKRIYPVSFRKPIIRPKTYEELRKEIEDLEGKFKTLVIDVGGKLIALLKEWAMRTDPTARKKSGGISQTGFGKVKTEFEEFDAYIRSKFDVIYTFHEKKSENDDQETFFDIICEGGAKDLVWQPADIAAHVHILNDGKRYLGFTPTSHYNAKAAYGIKGLVPIKELKEGEPNNLLTILFQQVRENMAAEAAALKPQKEAYDRAMAEGLKIIEQIDVPEKMMVAWDSIKALDHGLTSQKELEAALKAHAKANGWAYSKEAKAYVAKAE